MPIRPLPKKLVNWLQAAARRGLDLGQMENVDHRQRFPDLVFTPEESTNVSGRRVRQINVGQNFPRENLKGVVIKRTHDLTARETIRRLQNIVKSHNAKYTPSNYALLMPHAYEIGEDLIAMAKTSNPSVQEILSKSGSQTQRGKDFFGKIAKKFSVTENDLRAAAETVKEMTGILQGNLLLLGYIDKRFIFMPLIDIGKGDYDVYF